MFGKTVAVAFGSSEVELSAGVQRQLEDALQVASYSRLRPGFYCEKPRVRDRGTSEASLEVSTAPPSDCLGGQQ